MPVPVKYMLMMVVCLFGLPAWGQNLVTNPSFEFYNNCPNDRGQVIFSQGFNDFPTVLDWMSPSNTTPDYFNRCSTTPSVSVPYLAVDGFHEPHSGNAFAGVSMYTGYPDKDTGSYWCEYLETRLSEPLQAGHDYCVSFYVSLTYHQPQDYNIIAVDGIGLKFSRNMLDTTGSAPYFFLQGTADIRTPAGRFITDTSKWTLVSGIYHAQGGERWITIGRFNISNVGYVLLYSRTNNINGAYSTCYMLVDDVSVVDMNTQTAIDTNVYTPQFPISIGQGRIPASTYRWSTGEVSQDIMIQDPAVYYRERWTECGYYVDTFRAAQMPVEACTWLPSAFTPNNDGLNDRFGPGNNFCTNDLSAFTFSIYNRWGQRVFHTVIPGDKWDGSFNGMPQEMGTYTYTLQYAYRGAFVSRNMNGDLVPVTVNGDVTLVR